MKDSVKQFIQEHKDLIENDQWEEFYVECAQSVSMVGEVTEILLKAGIKPLDYLNYIPDYYFMSSNIEEFKIPNGVTSIGVQAFCNCSGLTSITIGNSVESISTSAFFGCSSLKSITIPDSVKSIGLYAFSGCSELTSVTIGNGVTSIGNYAFGGCIGLTSIIFKGTKKQWKTIIKGQGWNYKVSTSCTVHCTDEDIKL